MLIDRDAWLAQDVPTAHALAASVPGSRRPSWASGVLLAAIHASGREDCASDLFRLVTDVAEDERRWGEAHSMFREVRQETLRLESSDGDPLCKALVLMAESASKVIYNASGHAAPFDANSGIVLVLRAAELAATLDDGTATDLLWHAAARIPTTQE